MKTTDTYADLIIPLPLNQLFTYIVPKELISACKVGVRVIVPFGKKKIYTGIVKTIHTSEPDYETKEIISVLDENPIISSIQFKLWEWVADYYMCTQGEVYKAALPAGLKLESETIISILQKEDPEKLSEKEETVVNFVLKNHSVTISKLTNEFDFNVLPIVKILVDKGIVSAEEWIKKKYKPKFEEYIRLTDSYKNLQSLKAALSDLSKAKKQSELLQSFLDLSGIENLDFEKQWLKKELLHKSKSTSAILKSLIDKGYLLSEKIEVSRIETIKFKEEAVKTLNEAQLKAHLEIQAQFETKNVVLLHGITSSGKTEIYIELIKAQLEKGRQVLYLLPEIALTAQITTRLAKIFGDKLGIYHSKFSDNERVEVWKRLHEIDPNKRFQIILGVRSSIFLPFNDLGLIIVDEEHENTYKQFNPAPRYNARDLSVVLAQFHNAKVLLGTATPSIESYYNANSGKYGLVELFKRYKDIKLPDIQLDDTKEARRKLQMKSIFAPKMMEALKNALNNKEQVILFQNRRGFSPFTECEACGHIPKCENCDVSLSYHKYTNNLVCHYCGYTEHASKTCNKCKSQSMRTRGFGTQKIEDEIKLLFPGVKTSRMDMDSIGSKKAYHKIIHEFETGKTDVLIGTQMISKGLDFDNVSLVGIMNADNMLNFPDFRAFERSFQLMAQVSGRAGRKNKQGKVIIQTSDKEHPIIMNVINNDYYKMYVDQLAVRKQFKYPPYYRLIQLSVKHKKKEIVEQASELFAKELRAVFGNRVLGPEFPVISRIKTWYIKNILIKLEKKISHKKAKELITKSFYKVKCNENFKSVQIIADVDPI